MRMNMQASNEQAALWNGVAGQAWVDAETLLDGVFKPLEVLLADAVIATGASDVLDIGCGTGATTLAAARALGQGARCVGLDISAPMIAAARARAEREGVSAGFICADAATWNFDATRFDLLISRFGVMFFDDPVAAFANLRRAARPGARLRLLVWRGPQDNPFMMTAENAARPLLPDLPLRVADVPGQFAFANREHVERILGGSGWTGIALRPIDVQCQFPASELTRYFTQLGPLGRALSGASEELRGRVIDAVRPAFKPYVHGDEVRFVAACWMVESQAS
jgi:SAM-dependent methyltransferase